MSRPAAESIPKVASNSVWRIERIPRTPPAAAAAVVAVGAFCSAFCNAHQAGVCEVVACLVYVMSPGSWWLAAPIYLPQAYLTWISKLLARSRGCYTAHVKHVLARPHVPHVSNPLPTGCVAAAA